MTGRCTIRLAGHTRVVTYIVGCLKIGIIISMAAHTGTGAANGVSGSRTVGAGTQTAVSTCICMADRTGGVDSGYRISMTGRGTIG